MDLFNLFALLTSFAAFFSWLNHKTLRLPPTIGLMVIALAFSLVLVAMGALGFGFVDRFAEVVGAIDFDETLLHGFLGALLFAGALHVDLDDVARQKGVIAVLVSVGLLISTGVVGALAWWLFGALGFSVPFLFCLLFGAIVSPTDPVAVLGILKHVAAPHTLSVKIAGESLFNDGVAVVLFIVLLRLAAGEADAGPAAAMLLFAEEALGGIVYGLVLGGIAYGMLRSVDSYPVEILVTLAIVTGGYALAQQLHTSGPLAMVVAGLFIGNHGRALAMSKRTREHLDTFWELVDEFLNAVLFMLIGFELLVVDFTPRTLAAGLLAIPVVLAARWLAVAVPVTALRRARPFSPHAVKVLAWSGLRGGISVALALSLPAHGARDLLVAATYVVVAFSIIVQGLTVAPLLRRLYGDPNARA